MNLGCFPVLFSPSAAMWDPSQITISDRSTKRQLTGASARGATSARIWSRSLWRAETFLRYAQASCELIPTPHTELGFTNCDSAARATLPGSPAAACWPVDSTEPCVNAGRSIYHSKSVIMDALIWYVCICTCML